VVQRALRAMLGSLTRGDSSERETVLDLTVRVLSALVARGHPTEAAQAVAQLNLIFQSDDWLANDARAIVREAVTSDKVLFPAIRLLDNPKTSRVAFSILNHSLPERVDILVARLANFKTPEGRHLMATLVKARDPSPDMMRTLVGKSDLELYEEALFIADGGSVPVVDQVWRSGLIHPSVAVRRRALKSVPKNRVMALRDALHPLLTDAEKDIRAQVRDLITSARDQGSIEQFTKIFNNSRLHEDERRTAIAAIALIGGPEASRVLMKGLAELTMPDLRVACALALGNHGDASAIPLLESIAAKTLTWKSLKDACKEAVNRIQVRTGATQTRTVPAGMRQKVGPGGTRVDSRAAAPKKSLDELPPKIIRMIEEGLIPIPKGYEASKKIETKPTVPKATRAAVLMPAAGGSLFDKAAPVTRTIRPGSDAAQQKAKKKTAGSDLDIVFDGYVVFQDKGELVFGRRWGAQLLDVHAYAAADVRIAYAHFLMDKLAEEFLPQNDRQRMILPGRTLNKLDLELLDLVYAEVREKKQSGEKP
jgi:HEAT repeat protein